MKIMLTEDVESLGLAGEVHVVADGYGRNYLIPQGLAVLATEGALKDAETLRRRAEERRRRVAEEMAALAETIGQTELVFLAKAGEKGRLYGSVTTSDIAEKLTEAVDYEIDRRKISLDAPIKQVGTHTVRLQLSTELLVDFDVTVESEDEDEEAEPEAAAAVEVSTDAGEMEEEGTAAA
jgi:large subunit ribosomal protein L9